ncbi:phosphonoacetate hydrolase [Geminicoccaceae bacterium 1502E]|nr:phosphonoacetate hydrolase [Geminicoccaceae bacterium 1502E]
MSTIKANGRDYRKPAETTVVVCFDGCDPAYLEAARRYGVAPFLTGTTGQALTLQARSAMPSFTNPNNISIVTGVTPETHGIAGNYFLDPATGEEVMMNFPRFMTCGTILAALAAEGVGVGVVTAKDKLLRMLVHGMPASELPRCRSIEAGGSAPFLPPQAPDMYGPLSTLEVLDSGIRMIAQSAPQLVYLSTTDYMQHTYAPEDPEALAFYQAVDARLAKLHAMGVRLVVTADHGMNAKTTAEGALNAIWLAEIMDELGADGRVILPITDPHVKHHGALGSLAHVYLDDRARLPAVQAALAGREGVACVLPRNEAAARLELPAERIGDLVVVATAAFVLGTRAGDHDLAQLDRKLRSHGGFGEQIVPFIVNRQLVPGTPTEGLRNFDAFHIALNQLLPAGGSV